MTPIRPWMLAAAAGVLLHTGEARACSMMPFPAFRDGVHLIATATEETVRAGAGGMEFVTEPGADPDSAGVGGQVVRVERLGGSGAAGLDAGVDRVVLVPWSYGADCRPMRWTGSAQWVTPGVRGLFWAALRPREQWVDGLPTLDVRDPFHLPYLAGGAGVRDGEERTGPPLSVDQAFELIGLLPLSAEYEADEKAAVRPLLEWARAHPGLARRYPASVLVRHASYEMRAGRLKAIRPPLAGTYRFTVTVDEGAPRIFHARTRATPYDEWTPGAEFESQPTLDEPIYGYSLWMVGSASADSLPSGAGADPPGGFVSLLAEPEAGPGGAQLWRGRVELGLVQAAFPGDSVVAGIAEAALERYSRRWQAREPEEIFARFLLRPDGSVLVEQTTVLDDGRTVVLRGERISRVTIPDAGEPD
ncbi:MAG TPA: hypothetical protein VHG08_28255 [Longimicrobium sp.]|nr:hypothetical protein [Longimicrobium sp.]